MVIGNVRASSEGRRAKHMSAASKAVPIRPSKDTPKLAAQSTRNELYAAGKAMRDKTPRTSHAEWTAPRGRRDPVELLLQAEKGRIPDLLPLRHGRMVRSAFTFYRGSALAMAADLASTPSTGVYVQCCGDAHLCNFGGFATPERKVIFSERELTEIETSLRQGDEDSGKSPEELQQFVHDRLLSLPDLLSCDVPRARAELAKHVSQITMHPTDQNGTRHYVCQGDWNLLGSLTGRGDVRMVAGGGFEPPTFGL
jgi:hypothetical protein